MQGKHTQSSRCSQSHGHVLLVTWNDDTSILFLRMPVESWTPWETNMSGRHSHPHPPGKTMCLCEGVCKQMQARSHYMAGDASMILFMWWVCILSHGPGELLSFLGIWKLLWTKWVVLWAKSGHEALDCEAMVACLTLTDTIRSRQSKE